MKQGTHIVLCLIGFVGSGCAFVPAQRPRGVAACSDDGLGLRAGDRPVAGGSCSSCVDMAGML